MKKRQYTDATEITRVTTDYQQTGQPRTHREIPRNLQPTKTVS